jgi:hypothetical protein
LLKRKYEVFLIFKHYKNNVENQFDKKIKVIRSDKGEEYEAQFGESCFQNDIIHQTTAPYSSSQNDITEYKN